MAVEMHHHLHTTHSALEAIKRKVDEYARLNGWPTSQVGKGASKRYKVAATLRNVGEIATTALAQEPAGPRETLRQEIALRIFNARLERRGDEPITRAAVLLAKERGHDVLALDVPVADDILTLLPGGSPSPGVTASLSTLIDADLAARLGQSEEERLRAELGALTIDEQTRVCVENYFDIGRELGAAGSPFEAVMALKARVVELEAAAHPTVKVSGDAAEMRERAAHIAYRVCAETRHIGLGNKARAAIRALPLTQEVRS